MKPYLWPVVIGGVLWLIAWTILRRGVREHKARAAKRGQLASLSADTAARRAEVLITDPKLFRTVSVRSEPGEVRNDLPTLVREVFARFEEVEQVGPPYAALRRSLLHDSSLRAGYVRIGEIQPATDAEGEIAVRP